MEISAEIKKATDPIYQKISSTVPEIEWVNHAPYIYKINKLKISLKLSHSSSLIIFLSNP